LLRVLGEAQTILIDLPGYSKTDMRRVTTDLETIYWLWNELAPPPTSQTEVAQLLSLPEYAVSRYTKCDRKGVENIMALLTP